jgi:hypothetical protein
VDNSEAKKNIVWLRAYSSLLDSKFKIPFTNFTFGVDPILSVIPIFGSLAGIILALPIFYFAYHHKASHKLLTLMLKNTLIDTLIGEIPVIGAIGDVFNKSNNKNIQLIEEHFMENKHQGSGYPLMIGIVSSIIVFSIILITVAAYLFHKLLQFIGNL